MNIFSYLHELIKKELEHLVGAGDLPAGLEFKNVTVEPPRDASHGDVATNAALVLAKQAKMKPRDIAEILAVRLEGLDDVQEVAVAGPGFINLRLAPAFWRDRLREILDQGLNYGDSQAGGGEKVNVEYVSANPTGPLHMGHARGAVIGDALANLLEKAGYDVAREYYINDAGAQVDKLAYSTYFRYREALGNPVSDPAAEGFQPDDGAEYQGEYLIPVGKALADRHGDEFADAAIEDWLPAFRDFTIAAMMDQIRADLAVLGIEQEVFSSERALVEAGRVEAAIEDLKGRSTPDGEPLIYEGTLEPPKGNLPDDWEAREQTLFRSTAFGDDVDRPVKKSDGGWTYFATDIAYHHDKYLRGFASQIDVWGADHGGYVKRMKAAVSAMSDGEAELDVKLCNLVKLLRDGEPVTMSKRAGNFVTLSNVVDEVGRDVVRFIMLTRRNDAPLDFDFSAVTEQSRDNPVFYVQYAHARVHSVLRNAEEAFDGGELGEIDAVSLAGADLARLEDEDEIALIKLMAGWPQTVEAAARAHEPHRLAFYLNDLAAGFHQLWNRGKEDVGLRFINADDVDLTRARLALIRATATVITSGLAVMGVEPVKEMR